MNVGHSSGKWAGSVWGAAARGFAACLPALLLAIMAIGAVTVPGAPALAQAINCTGGPVAVVHPQNVSVFVDVSAGTCGINQAVLARELGDVEVRIGQDFGLGRVSGFRYNAAGAGLASRFQVCDFGDGDGDKGIGSCRSTATPLDTNLTGTFEWDSTTINAPYVTDRRLTVNYSVAANGGTITSAQVTILSPEINVTGNGQSIASGDVTPEAADHTAFGAAVVTGGTVARTFTIQNTGDGDLELGNNAVSLAGAHAGDFTVTAQLPIVVSPGSPRTFTVTFDPSAAGNRQATISIANNDADEAPYTFAISGTGTVGAPEINVTGNGRSITSGDATPATADHTDFGSAGVTAGTITRTFTIENTGAAVLTLGANAVSLAGANAAEFTITTQPAVNVAAAGTTTFSLTFDPAAAGARVATVTINNDDADESPYTFAIQGTGQVGGTITLVQIVTGPDVTTEFSSATAALNTTLKSVGGAAARTITAVPVGTHTITAANLAALGYGITGINCDDGDSSVDVANGSATIVLAGSDAVTCTFVIVESRVATARMIAEFLGARGIFLLSNQPGTGRRTGRFVSNGGGSDTAGSVSAFGLSGTIPVPLQAAFSGNSLSFATSHGWGQTGMRRLPDAMTRVGAKDTESDDARPVLTLDKRTVWVEGTIAGFDDRQSDGTFGVVYAGADQLVTADILVGALVQYDWFRQKQDTGGGKVTGRGWMAGPYATFRLDERLFADIRFAWGRSRNDITPIGTYTDTFDTTRWLASGAFIGNFAYGGWSVQPTMSLAYLRETQKRYTDSLGVDIPGQSISQGEVKAGPRIGYAHLFDTGDRLEPFVSLDGAYVFGDDGLYSDGSLAKEASGLRGRLGYGLDWRSEAGQSLSVSGTYDGIGTNVDIVGVSLKLSIPLN